ncbi:antitoxin MazE [Andreesenia angusta]|uniref:Antitoxin MazE n=1 Tax=Andreesenia angusta TaxID=39480 RepID=A0A1S1VC50_9FIRM|nr:AbrB/MazE/SpoVT family DNA-binding domain-containing protein [Andreesenia angusta]OHW63379.1 antitoxin MazE [Andreesenia angusta]
MLAKIQKWGNSNGIRIPKSALETVHLKENDKVEIVVKEGNIIIMPLKKHKTFEERIAGFTGEYEYEEWDTGEPVGEEVF